MKILNTFRSQLTALAACALIVSALSASAQQPGAGGGGGGGFGGGGGGGGFGGFGAAFTPLSDAGQEARATMNTDTTDALAKLNLARTNLNVAIFAAKLDEAGIKTAAAAVASAEADYALAVGKSFDKLRAKFTAEDISTLKVQGPRGFGGFGGRGGGRGPGGPGGAPGGGAPGGGGGRRGAGGAQ